MALRNLSVAAAGFARAAKTSMWIAGWVSGWGVALVLAYATAAFAANQAGRASANGGQPTKPAAKAAAAVAADAPIPDLKTLMEQVREHQKAMDKLVENCTYRSETVNQYLDGHGKVMKTESEIDDVFFVNGHEIDRVMEKNGKPLSGHEADKEQERVTKQVEKAQQTPPGQSLRNGGQTITVSKMLDVMEVSQPRRVMYKGRSTLVFDLAGRHDAKTHGMAEGALKRIAGSIWIDEKDREVAHLEMRFTDNFRVGGGLLANVQKGSAFQFDQGQVNGEVWLPQGAQGTVDAKLLLFKGMRMHFVETDSEYKWFHVDAEQGKSVADATGAKQNP